MITKQTRQPDIEWRESGLCGCMRPDVHRQAPRLFATRFPGGPKPDMGVRGLYVR